MKRKIIILVCLLITIPSLIFFFSNRPGKEQLTTQQPTNNTTPSPIANAQTILSFSQNPYIIASASGSIDLVINSGENNITAVQIELLYNPDLITNVNIKPGNFLDNSFELLKKIDTNTGKIIYAVAIQPAGTPRKGTGKIASITFTSNLSAGQKTEIKILPTTLVTAENEQASVLKQATGVIITK